MTKDLNKGISDIQYNVLNLPNQIDIKNPVAEARNEYHYSADGVKRKVIKKWNPNYSTNPVMGSNITVSSLTSMETTDYVGNLVFVNNSFQRALTENGYIEGNVYHYNIKDHLGSTRVVVNSSDAKVQCLHYYPFGMMFGDVGGLSLQPYKYTGQEFDHTHGLNLYDYKARLYDPAIPRFTTMDPMAEKTPWISPYAYCFNNPLRFIDPTGMMGGDIQDRQGGSEEFEQEQKSKDVFERIKKSISRLFSINIDGRTPEAFKASTAEQAQNMQTIEQVTDLINTATDAIASFIPGGSMALNITRGINGSEVSGSDYIFASLDFLPVAGVGGKVGAKTFFNGAKYSNKIIRQMGKSDDILHAFPSSVDGFATKFGRWSSEVGADGKSYQWLKMQGSYGGKTGTFEYIKDSNGIINHRYFNVHKGAVK